MSRQWLPPPSLCWPSCCNFLHMLIMSVGKVAPVFCYLLDGRVGIVTSCALTLCALRMQRVLETCRLILILWLCAV